MRTTALGKTALTLSALLATGTAATAGLYVTLAGAAVGQSDDSADSVAAGDQVAQPSSSDPTTAGSQRAQDVGPRTSPSATTKARPSFSATPTPQKTSAPAHTKTKGS